MRSHPLLSSLFFCAVTASFISPILAATDLKLGRALLDNDFESESVSPWYDESPGRVNWRVENSSVPLEINSTAPLPSIGTKYLRAVRADNSSSGLAIFTSPVFSAEPGDKVSFDFWIRSRRPEGNNLQLFWVVGTTETLLTSLSQFSTAANYEWRSESVAISVTGPTVGHLSFHGYCGVYPEDAIAIDNIIVESSSLTTQTPGTGCVRLEAYFGTFTTPNYPSNYPNNANLCWLITGVSYISLHFNGFETELGRDTLKIYLGQTTSSPLYADLSGTYFPNSIYQYTDAMLFVFTSDSANAQPGFSISYDVVKVTPTTPGTASTTPSSSSRPTIHSVIIAVLVMTVAIELM